MASEGPPVTAVLATAGEPAPSCAVRGGARDVLVLTELRRRWEVRRFGCSDLRVECAAVALMAVGLSAIEQVIRAGLGMTLGPCASAAGAFLQQARWGRCRANLSIIRLRALVVCA